MVKSGNEDRRRGATAHRGIPGLVAAILMGLPLSAAAGDVWIESRPHPEHGLEGHKVAIDAGHGRTWNDTTRQWGWQRPVLFGEVEDLITARIVNRWLVPYFQNAGGYVCTMRERDEQIRELYLDDAPASGSMETSGDWTAIAPSGSFSGGARVAATQSDSGGPFAVWSADFPATDRYGLCLWYPAVDTPTTATYVVHAAGGDVLLRVNQRVNTARWLFIDWFVFEEGSHPVVTLTTLGSEPGTVVAADGVRLGGGMGDIEFGGGPSGLPRWQEYSKSYAMLYGAPASIWDYPVEQHDYSVRYPFMGWLGTAFEFNLHSNSDATGSGSASGTVSPWAYARNETEVAQLLAAHRRVTQLIKERWMSTWRDRGDTLPTLYSWMSAPRWLIELAFHDRLDPDLISLLDPDFRSIAARGIYEAIGAMLAGEGFVALPEPPQAVAMINQGGGAVQFRWEPPAWGPAVRNYRVYRSGDALAFDAGVDVGNVIEFTFEGESAGAAFYARVVAENEGGRSFPSETLGVRVGDSPTVLVVNGFDRLDRYVQEPDNPRRFVKEHIEAFAAARPAIAIDSAANEAVENGTVALAGYPVVDWVLGRESVNRESLLLPDLSHPSGALYETHDETFTETEQATVSAYLNEGGRLLVTGTDIAFDLIQNGNSIDRQFADEQLHLEHANRGRRTPRIVGREQTLFEGFSCDIATTPSQPYDAGYADVLGPSPGANPVLFWSINAEGAGIAYGTGPGKTLVLAAPLEAMLGSAARADFAGRALDYLLSPLEADIIAPTVFSVSIHDVLAREAVVRWTASELVVGEAHWGLDTAYGSTSGPTTFYSKSGSLSLSGLQPETTYHLSMWVRDAAGNPGVSGDYEFTTLALDTTPPVVSRLQVYPYSPYAAWFCWETDEPASCAVEYRKDHDTGWSLVEYQSPSPTRHNAHVTYLDPDSTYVFHIRAEDPQHNVGYTTDSLLLTGPVDRTPPVIEQVRVVDVSDRDAILSWTTDEPAKSRVEWWSDTTTITLGYFDGDLSLAHTCRVNGLTTDTLIHARAVSRDAAGNEARSREVVFRTLAPIPDVVVDNSDPGCTVQGVWSTSTMAPEQRWGPDYRWRAVKYPGDTPMYVTWRGVLPRGGSWQANCWYVVGANRSNDVPYFIRYPEGEEIVRVDQVDDGGIFFHPIGAPRHYPGGEAEIAVSNDATTGRVVVADAVMWSFRGTGEAWRYRVLTARQIVAHVVHAWPLDADFVSQGDVNQDGVVDVADAILRRMELNETP